MQHLATNPTAYNIATELYCEANLRHIGTHYTSMYCNSNTLPLSGGLLKQLPITMAPQRWKL